MPIVGECTFLRGAQDPTAQEAIGASSIGECMAGALSGVELPGYGPGPYEVTIIGSRERRTSSPADAEDPGLFENPLLWLGLGLALTACLTLVLVVQRRRRKPAL
jgi:hypothetical protein